MDKFKQLSTFVDVMALGSLSAAARNEGVAAAVIGRRLDALEERLGVRLLQRTTRRIALTDEGQAFLEEAQRILSDLATAEAAVSAGSVHATGQLRISAPGGFGRRHIAPLIPSFLAEHRDVKVTLDLTDRVVDLIGDGVDVAVRIAPAVDSSLISITLAENRRVVVASPDYLQRHGTPQSLADLDSHQCLAISQSTSQNGQQRGWTFCQHAKIVTIRTEGSMSCSDGEVLCRWALAGRGLAWRSWWEVQEAVEAGALKTVLDHYAAPASPISAVFVQRQHLPLRVRVFVDFLRRAFSDLEWPRRGAQII